MLYKTRGIVLKVTDYADTSVIVQIFTEKFGVQSYLINGVKKAKAKIKINMLQPLHLLEMVVYHKPNGNIQRISEIRNLPIFHNIPYQIVKSCITLFLNEVVYKSVKTQHEDPALFEFLYNSITLLDIIEEGLPNFHLLFLVQLSRYLGFFPNKSSQTVQYFDLVNSLFTNQIPEHALILFGKQLELFNELLLLKFNELGQFKITTAERRTLLQHILKYYELHLDNFNNIKSHLILEEVLS